MTPSKSDIEQLREEGIVFVSQRTSQAVARGVMLLLLTVLLKQVPLLFQIPERLTPGALLTILMPWFWFVILSVFLVAGISFFLTLLQTKFYMRIQIVDEDTMNNGWFRFFIIDLLFLIVFCCGAWYVVTPEIFVSSDMDVFMKMLRSLLILAGGFRIAGGLLLFLLDRRAFLNSVAVSR